MGAKKPRIVIIGAGMAGLTAANKLYTNTSSRDLFELCVVEGGARIGGRINSFQFCGDKIEMGATWIHGIGGSSIYQIAQDIGALESQRPWECMDGFLDVSKTVAEGGFEVKSSIVEPISVLFKLLMDFAQGKSLEHVSSNEEKELYKIPCEALKICTSNGSLDRPSIGGFLRKGLDIHWESFSDQKELKGYGNWSRNLLEEAIFAMHENIQRTYTSAGDLSRLDFDAESEYRMFPGEEITIAKGYSSIIEHLASVLPPELIQLGKKVTKIEWQHGIHGHQLGDKQNGYCDTRPVKLHFSDGSTSFADHVIVTVSLGVLKAGIREDLGLFSPPLPSFKTEAISRLGFGVVNKLFLQIDPKSHDTNKFPFLQMAFHRPDSELRNRNVPWWMRRTASLCPIYHNSSILLSWFAGKEALELESLKEEEIIDGFSRTISCLLPQQHEETKSTSHELCNGNGNSTENSSEIKDVRFKNVLKSQWGKDPLFLGSYSYVAVGSSGDDFNMMAEPLPRKGCEMDASSQSPPLQILFAGEATHRTHYSTTHGAYYSGLREANRLLQHYHCL